MAKRVETLEELTTAQIVGRRLYEARLSMRPRMTQTDAAVALARVLPWAKPHSSTISRIETGQNNEPDVYVIAALARLYHKTLAEIAPEYLGHAQTMYLVLEDVIDVTDLPEVPLTCEFSYGSQDPLPFDEDELPDVIDLRDHVVQTLTENGSLALYANAS